VGPSGLQVGLVAVLEIGVTAALAAGGANWLILYRAANRARAEEVTQPVTVVDNDDPDGHRIYLNPWAADELAPGLQHADPGVDGAGELVLAGLGGRDAVRLAEAR